MSFEWIYKEQEVAECLKSISHHTDVHEPRQCPHCKDKWVWEHKNVKVRKNVWHYKRFKVLLEGFKNIPLKLKESCARCDSIPMAV